MRISNVVVLLVLIVAACKSSSETSDKGGAADKSGDKTADKDGKAAAKTQSKADYEREANQATDDLNEAEADKPAITPADPLKLVQTIADQMCACTTAECAQHVMEANAAEMEKLAGFKPTSTEQGDAMMEASKRMSDCASKIPT
jgi:hypothetical protein